MSLVELIVAILLLSVGLMGLSGLSLTVTTQYKNAGRQAFAAAVVQSRLDSLSSIGCANLAVSGTQTGVATSRGVTERWSVSDGNDVKTIIDTVSFAGRRRPLVYTSVIPCRD
jgi:Tfp pilus assembly protein PilV